MHTRKLPLCSLFLVAPLVAQDAALLPLTDPPPGLVLITGGETQIGTDQDDVLALIKSGRAGRGWLRTLDAETPRHEVDVADFLIGRFEVTTEQYAAFVAATGHRPPLDWGLVATEVAREAFVHGERAGQDKFHAGDWWASNWEGHAWAVPSADLLRPVTNIDLADARAFLAWAGLRLPKEAEFQRACRGDGDDAFPWGPDWKPDACATSELRRIKKVFEIGSFPAGANSFGVHDLLGNVWEWTASAYAPYPDFEIGRYKLDKGRRAKPVSPRHGWPAGAYVVVGGSYKEGPLAARATTRRSTDRHTVVAALGFRAVGSPRAGRDRAQALLARVQLSEVLRPGTTFAPDRVVGLDRWETRASVAAGELPEGYAVITAYRHVCFVPVERIDANSTRPLQRESRATPVQLGVLSTSEPLREPTLAPGVYLVEYRAGKNATDPDQLLFQDIATGALAATTQLARTLKVEKVSAGGAWGVETVRARRKNAQGHEVREDEPRLALELVVPARASNWAVTARVLLDPLPAFFEDAWRR